MVDPDKLSSPLTRGGSGGSGNTITSGSVTANKLKQTSVTPSLAPITTPRTMSNTCDVRDKNLVEAQQTAMDYFEKLFDQLYGDDSDSSGSGTRITRDSNIVYIHVGNHNSNNNNNNKPSSATTTQIQTQQTSASDVSNRLRAWLKDLSLVSRVQVAESSQGGEAYIAVELAFDSSSVYSS